MGEDMLLAVVFVVLFAEKRGAETERESESSDTTTR
jgi:hypothetical protein